MSVNHPRAITLRRPPHQHLKALAFRKHGARTSNKDKFFLLKHKMADMDIPFTFRNAILNFFNSCTVFANCYVFGI